MMLSQLIAIMPAARDRAEAMFIPLATAMRDWDIGTEKRQAAFLATIAAETGQMSNFSEGLSYSAQRLMAVWPTRFKTFEQAAPYARNPEALANKVYASRGGNGPEESGDGWRFRGAGAIQLTFRDNHAACAGHFGIPLEEVGAWLLTPTGAFQSAGWFWRNRLVNDWADKGDFDGVCDIVNIGRKTDKIGDAIGYAERFSFYKTALKVLA